MKYFHFFLNTSYFLFLQEVQMCDVWFLAATTDLYSD